MVLNLQGLLGKQVVSKARMRKFKQPVLVGLWLFPVVVDYRLGFFEAEEGEVVADLGVRNGDWQTDNPAGALN